MRLFTFWLLYSQLWSSIVCLALAAPDQAKGVCCSMFNAVNLLSTISYCLLSLFLPAIDWNWCDMTKCRSIFASLQIVHVLPLSSFRWRYVDWLDSVLSFNCKISVAMRTSHVSYVAISFLGCFSIIAPLCIEVDPSCSRLLLLCGKTCGENILATPILQDESAYTILQRWRYNPRQIPENFW